jgi:hypothetical protein
MIMGVQSALAQKGQAASEDTSFTGLLHKADKEVDLDELAEPITGEWTDAQKEELSKDGNLVSDLVLVGGGKGAAERVADGLQLTDTEHQRGVLTRTIYTVPVRIEMIAKTDTTNLRLYFSRGYVILNWEVNPTELRVHEPRNGMQEGYADKGKVKEGEWHTVVWEVGEKGLRLTVDGEHRLTEAGDFSGVKGRVGVGPAWGSTLTLKSLKVK